MNDDFETEESGGGLLDRIKESPRTVSALIIILIVAAAIYAFSGDNNDQAPADTGDSVAVTDEAAVDEADDEAEEEDGEDTDEMTEATPAATSTPAPTPATVTREQLAQETQALPEASRSDQGFTEVAQAGDGITHLARRATTRWLSENQASYTVTNEHRIYIEDYLQNRLGSEGLSLGEQRTVSFDLIAEAVNAAGQLNDQQLRNLSQYTSAL